MSDTVDSPVESLDRVAILIPCYNEALTIGKVVDDFSREMPGSTIYVYDNNSSDGTADIAREHGATVVHEPRQGKGNVSPSDAARHRRGLLPHGRW